MGAPSSRTSVYLAAPLFTDAEREFNARLAARLEEAGYRVFLPQRDSPQDHEGTGYPARIFRADLEGLHQADVVVAVCDGLPVDEAVATLRALAPPGGRAFERTPA